MTGITMGNVTGVAIIDVTFDAASAASVTCAEQTVTVPGVKLGDMVFANAQTHTTGLGIAGARVSAADTVAVAFVNPTAGAVDAASKTYRFLIVRPEVSGATSFGM